MPALNANRDRIGDSCPPTKSLSRYHNPVFRSRHKDKVDSYTSHAARMTMLPLSRISKRWWEKAYPSTPAAVTQTVDDDDPPAVWVASAALPTGLLREVQQRQQVV
jgi:hypothetical protein